MMEEKIKNDNLNMDEEEKQSPYLLQVSQKAVIYDEETKKFLLVKNIDEEGFFSTHYGPWQLPGGRLLKGETLEESLERELREELGNEIKYERRETFDTIGIEYRTGKAIAIGHFLVYQGGEIKLSDEHSEYKWENLEEIRNDSSYRPWLKNFIEKAQKCIENQEAMDGWKRCRADFENYKKRQAQSQKEMTQYANLDLIMQIIPVIDNFYASTAHVPESQESQPWVAGILYIQKQLENILSGYGVEEISVKVGDSFDPSIHEAIRGGNCEEEEKKECQNKIKKIIQKGYKLGDRVIRAARVIVA